MKQHFVGKWVLTLAVLSACAVPSTSVFAKEAESTSGTTKNVILFVGDGMGAAARNAMRLSSKGVEGELAMDDMPVTGIVHTSSGSSFVTDSAAAATALATGVKTYNGAVGVDMDKDAVKTIMEIAKKAGKSIGIVTTSQVTDATGAAFGAHVASRSSQSDIAKQYLEDSKVDVILGGGEDYWYPQGEEGAFADNPPEDEEEESKGTQGNLVEKAKELGYTYVTSKKEMQKAEGTKLLGLFANEEMFTAEEEDKGAIYDPVVSLPDMTEKAIETLSQNKKGFFLVVEEEATDEMAHHNNAELTIKAGKELDKAVAVAKKFADKRSDTLVLVTADHETGGLSLETVSDSDESGEGMSAEDGPFSIADSKEKFVVDWTTSGHTAVDVPLTAMGKNAELFKGEYENTYVFEAMLKAMKLKK
ncbi:alkaline phosphatase [Brevibacillus migulae]|uniref:alkaline phosphatase n=1 Tax=Brevibacillus migulae TaxID=1644114 RepID=UPI00106ECF2F|nr:alkaline phosphatase [Brevibacillus migulae]